MNVKHEVAYARARDGAGRRAPVRITDEDGDPVCERCNVAVTVFSRLRGLMFRKQLPEDEGLLLAPAGLIHTCFMRFPIDAAFVDRNLTVVGVATNLRPWRAAGRRRARAVLELPAGAAESCGIETGMQLAIAGAAVESASNVDDSPHQEVDRASV